jgi:hypothetical protein
MKQRDPQLSRLPGADLRQRQERPREDLSGPAPIGPSD